MTVIFLRTATWSTSLLSSKGIYQCKEHQQGASAASFIGVRLAFRRPKATCKYSASYV